MSYSVGPREYISRYIKHVYNFWSFKYIKRSVIVKAESGSGVFNKRYISE
jgi:hypothetical protein